ncbi:MAG: phosphate ABC transporter permease subunit PstC [bacterium]
MDWKEKLIEKWLLFTACIAVLAVLLITIFIFKEGLPVIKHGIFSFIFGREWLPNEGIFGIFPMIIGSFGVTIGALLLGVPLGLACAVFLAELAPPKAAQIIRPAIELLAGIPSVVYGFFGLLMITPFIRDFIGGPGLSLLAGAVILAIMILPTIISISEDAIRAVPKEYKEGSLALGATNWQTIKNVILPAASSGIMAALVLGMGRAIGETMAVIMVTGNTVSMPNSILAPVRTLTGNIAIEMSYAADDHRQALFATGIVLFVIIMLINSAVILISKRKVKG